jgi:hypothetical protein
MDQDEYVKKNYDYNFYGPIILGEGEIKSGEPNPTLPVELRDGGLLELSKFHPLGWYASIKNPDRKWWQLWKSKTKFVSGVCE